MSLTLKQAILLTLKIDALHLNPQSPLFDINNAESLLSKQCRQTLDGLKNETVRETFPHTNVSLHHFVLKLYTSSSL